MYSSPHVREHQVWRMLMFTARTPGQNAGELIRDCELHRVRARCPGTASKQRGGGDSIPATEKPLPSPHRDGHLSPAPHVQAGQFEPHRTMAFEPVRFEVIRYTATIVTSQLRMAARLEY